MKTRGTWWLIFGCGVACAVAALVWVTAMTLRLERAELEARAEAQHEASVRLTLWKMDSWLGPRIAREAVRPYFEYQPFFANQRAYTRILSEMVPGEVYSPSPLLTYESELFPLHFQVNGMCEVTSPQVPEGSWLELAETCCLSKEQVERKRPLLERVRSLLQPKANDLVGCVSQAESVLANLMHEQDAPPQPNVVQLNQQWAWGAKHSAPVQNLLSKQDVQSRAMAYNMAQSQSQSLEQAERIGGMAQPVLEMPSASGVEIGPLVPLWLRDQSETENDGGESSAAQLVFIRRVRIDDQTWYQGFLGDWGKLAAGLLAQASDLLPYATLAAVTQPEAMEREVESGRVLASVPASLVAQCPEPPAGPAITPARATLGIAWLAVLAAVAAAGVTLRSSIAYGEKRSRFASAVTHELRTPLTTFRMYSEMLAEGMVRDDQQRAIYLNTLKDESNRLARLVENVLSYARLEDGRATSHAQRTTLSGLIERVKPALDRRANDASMELRIEQRGDRDATFAIDTEVVGQILFNLVDNACKYANWSADRRIEIDAEVDDRALRITVRDFGPGVPAEYARSIFKPFDRGRHRPGDMIPGVGLGLALARGLARDLGGDLTLDALPHGEPGARFRLSLPRRRT